MFPILCRLIWVSFVATPPACTLTIKFIFLPLFSLFLYESNEIAQLNYLICPSTVRPAFAFLLWKIAEVARPCTRRFLFPTPALFCLFQRNGKGMKAKHLHFNYFPSNCFPREFFKESSGGSCKLSRALFAIATPLRNVLNLMPWFDHTARRRNDCSARSSTPDNRLDCSTNRKLSTLSCSLMTGLPSLRVITFSAIFPGKLRCDCVRVIEMARRCN